MQYMKRSPQFIIRGVEGMLDSFTFAEEFTTTLSK